MTTGKNIDKPSWPELTPDERLEKRLEAWRSTAGIEFVTQQAEEDYNQRIANVIDAVQLKKTPRRIPVIPNLGAFAEAYCGYSHRDIIYDVDKAIEVMLRCTVDFNTDTRIGSGLYSARVYDIVGFKLYTWPGHGLPADADGIQFVEDEYMAVEDYDELIDNPTEYWQRHYLPGIMGELAALRLLPYPLFGAGATAAMPATLSAYGLPEVESALEKAMEAGREMISWQGKVAAAGSKLSSLGGTRGIILDMYRCPDKLLRAMEALVPIQIRIGVETARMGGFPSVAFALHKGADGFMSDEQFRTFYWPTLRQIALGLIEEGLILRMGAQGGYNSRLEVIKDMPKGRLVWAFGAETDMARAKEIVGNTACMTGNIPASLFTAGSVEQTTDYCRKLIDAAGKGGGYMLSTAAGVNRNGKIENVRAMIACAREYGAYR